MGKLNRAGREGVIAMVVCFGQSNMTPQSNFVLLNLILILTKRTRFLTITRIIA